jgi:hypothetical protein
VAQRQRQPHGQQQQRAAESGSAWWWCGRQARTPKHRRPSTQTDTHPAAGRPRAASPQSPGPGCTATCSCRAVQGAVQVRLSGNAVRNGAAQRGTTGRQGGGRQQHHLHSAATQIGNKSTAGGSKESNLLARELKFTSGRSHSAAETGGPGQRRAAASGAYDRWAQSAGALVGLAGLAPPLPCFCAIQPHSTPHTAISLASRPSASCPPLPPERMQSRGQPRALWCAPCGSKGK